VKKGQEHRSLKKLQNKNYKEQADGGKISHSAEITREGKTCMKDSEKTGKTHTEAQGSIAKPIKEWIG